jgi:putative ribosome biogenesis GTPase RsgA
MAKTFTAPFAQTPKNATAVTTGECTSYNGDTPANTVKLLEAGEDGAILTRLTAIPRATVTASSLLIFTSADAGVTKRLINSALMSAHTVETTTAIPVTTFDYDEDTPLRLKAGEELYVGNAVALADGVVFHAEFTDF